MTGFEDFMAQILLLIIPDPIFWALLFVVILVISLALGKINSSNAGMLVFISVWQLNSSIGGFFGMLNMLMLAGVGVVMILALMKIGNR